MAFYVLIEGSGEREIIIFTFFHPFAVILMDKRKYDPLIGKEREREKEIEKDIKSFMWMLFDFFS